MTLEQLYKTLCNEYNSGRFFLEGNRIGWIYKTEGVSTAEEAEDRWLSFLGAKLTVQSIIGQSNFRMIENFEINNKIGFFLEETKVECKSVEAQKKGIFGGLFHN
jgi:hypothetical protein